MLSKTRPRRLAVGYGLPEPGTARAEAIHADTNIPALQYASELQAGKLGPLVSVKDLWPTGG